MAAFSLDGNVSAEVAIQVWKIKFCGVAVRKLTLDMKFQK
jgi:hypothetical protein